ncbi:MAG: MFS transporter [Nitrososphaerota archaeon]
MIRTHLPAFISLLSEITIVMLSIYLPLRAYQLGANSFVVGLIGGSASLVYMFAPFFMGRLSDRIGPKKLVSIATIAISILCFVYAMIGSPLLFIPLRIVEGVAWAMIWAPLEALYSLTGKDTFSSLKVFNMAWGIGAMAAPILGVLIGHVIDIIFASSVAMLLSFFFSLSMKNITVHQMQEVSKDNTSNNFRNVIMLLAFAVAYGATTTTITTFYPKYASVSRLNSVEWGIIISSLLGGRLAAFITSSSIRKRIGIRQIQIIFSVAACSFPLASIIAPSASYLLGAVSLITGLSLGFVYSVTLYAMLTGSVRNRGMSAGLFESSLGLGSFIGPALAGVVAVGGLWLTMTIPILFLLAGIVPSIPNRT